MEDPLFDELLPIPDYGPQWPPLDSWWAPLAALGAIKHDDLHAGQAGGTEKDDPGHTYEVFLYFSAESVSALLHVVETSPPGAHMHSRVRDALQMAIHHATHLQLHGSRGPRFGKAELAGFAKIVSAVEKWMALPASKSGDAVVAKIEDVRKAVATDAPFARLRARVDAIVASKRAEEAELKRRAAARRAGEVSEDDGGAIWS